MSFIKFLEAIFNYEFLQRALISSIFIGVICSLIGVYIILKKLVFMGAGIAHASFAGGALGILLNINPFLVIFFFGSTSAVSIGYINEKDIMEDKNVAVGIIFSLTMALAILFISLIPSYNVAVNALLFGNVLVVTTEDLILLLVLGIFIIIVIYFIRKELYFITFDEEMAKATGIPVRIISYIFLILISITIVVSLKAIGAILVFAMIITPAAAAYQWSYRLNVIIYLSIIFGIFSSFFGLYLSYEFDLPSGSTITLVISSIFLLSMILSPKRRNKSVLGFEHEKKCNVCEKADIDSECDFCAKEVD